MHIHKYMVVYIGYFLYLSVDMHGGVCVCVFFFLVCMNVSLCLYMM